MSVSFHDGDNFIRNMVSVRCGGGTPWAPPARKLTRVEDLPIPLDDLMLDLRVDSDDEAATLERLARGAADFLERRTAYVLIPGVYQVDLDGWWPSPLSVQRGPLRTLDAIGYLDADGQEATADLAGFYVEEEDREFTVRSLSTFTRPTLWSEVRRVRLTFSAGFQVAEEVSASGDLQPAPDGLITTWVMLVGHFYRNRELFAAGKLEDVEMGAGNLLGAYRQWW